MSELWLSVTMQKAFRVVKLKSVFSSPKPTGLASEDPRHLVHTPPTQGNHYRPRVMYSDSFHFTQTLKSTHVVETLIVGVSGEVYSQTLT